LFHLLGKKTLSGQSEWEYNSFVYTIMMGIFELMLVFNTTSNNIEVICRAGPQTLVEDCRCADVPPSSLPTFPI
jgi:hypothetical protein